MTPPAPPSVTLLPCPFCGHDAYTTESDERWFVGCSGCYCNVGEAYDRSDMPEHIFGSEAEAITAWNTRTTAEAASAARVEELVDVLAAILPLLNRVDDEDVPITQDDLPRGKLCKANRLLAKHQHQQGEG